jgi:hypothetical protein
MQRRPAVDTTQLAQMRWWTIGFVALLELDPENETVG